MSAVLETRRSHNFTQEAPHRSRSLSEEIEYFRNHWPREGLPPNWADLPRTGFQIRTQLNLLFSQLTDIDHRGVRKEKLSRWLSQTEEDIKGFILEYLCEGLVFPIHYKIKEEEGRLTAPLYADKDIEDTVTSEERNGVVKQSVQRIKSFFLKSPTGSLAIMTSPAGWSGLEDIEGRPIIYPDSQTYILQKMGEDVFGFTVRTDFRLKEHRELLRRLHMQDLLSENASVCDYVENVVGIAPIEKPMEIKDIVDLMRDVRSESPDGSLFAYKNRLWAEIYRDLGRREELWRFDERTKIMVEDFKDYILFHNLSKEAIKEALAVTILRIARFLRGEKRGGYFPTETHPHPSLSYGRILKEVQALPGCAGGGSSKNLINSLTPRQTETADGVLKCVTCPFCKETVDAILTEDKIICPKCNKSANRK